MYKTRCRVVEDHQGHRAPRHRCRIQSSRRSRRRPPPHAPGATHPIRKLAPKTHTGPSSSDFRAEAHHQHHPCTHTTHAARKAGGKGRARRGPVPAHPATAVVSRPSTRPNLGGTARTRQAANNNKLVLILTRHTLARAGLAIAVVVVDREVLSACAAAARRGAEVRSGLR